MFVDYPQNQSLQHSPVRQHQAGRKLVPMRSINASKHSASYQSLTRQGGGQVYKPADDFEAGSDNNQIPNAVKHSGLKGKRNYHGKS